MNSNQSNNDFPIDFDLSILLTELSMTRTGCILNFQFTNDICEIWLILTGEFVHSYTGIVLLKPWTFVFPLMWSGIEVTTL